MRTNPEPESELPEFKPLTAEQAQELRERNPPLSPWRVIAVQLVSGVVVALLAWAVTGKDAVAWSAAWGALAVVIPGALFARGLSSPVARANAGSAVFAFFLWEMVKIALTVAMLFAAPRLVTNLSWPALLVGLVVALKIVWLVPVFRKSFSAKPKTSKS